MKFSKKYMLLIFLLFVCNTNIVNAETIKIIDCEYTSQYKEWLKLSEKDRKKIDMPPKCKTSDMFYTKVGTSVVNETYESEKFDLRDYNYVSSVKNQENTGTCWTFGTYGSIESNLLLNNKGSYDFSEAHLGFAAQNTFQSLMPANRQYFDGGNYFISSAYLFNRMGMVLESDMPFSTMLNAVNNNVLPTLKDIKDKQVHFSVNSTSVLSSNQGSCANESITSIKKYLISNGAIGATMFFDYCNISDITEDKKIISSTVNGEYYYYNNNTTCGYLFSGQKSNHAVTIVGWDDSIEASNFSQTPSRNGAWIVKNSYGTSGKTSNNEEYLVGDAGYYYVSYDDINICTNLTGFYDISEEKEDNAYYHDILGLNAAYDYKKDIYLANVFERKHEMSEKLEKVTFFAFEVNQKFDVLLSKNGDLSNATILKSGVTDRIGYFTIDIDDVILSDSDYGVIIKLYHNVDNENVFPIYEKVDGTFFTYDPPADKSFLSVDGVEWVSFTINGKNKLIPIRTYTNNLDYILKENQSKTVDNKFVITYDFDGQFDINKFKYNIYKENDTSFSTNLKTNFNVDNKFQNSKNLTISLNDKSSVGDYVLVLEYDETKIITKFSVSKDSLNKLVFGKIELPNVEQESDNNKNNSGNVNIEEEDNPLNNDVNNLEGSSNEKDKVNNPKTGDKGVYVIFIIMISAISIILFKKKKIEENKL